MQINRLPLNVVPTSTFRTNVGVGNDVNSRVNGNVSSSVPNYTPGNTDSNAPVDGRRALLNPTVVIAGSESGSRRSPGAALVNYSKALQVDAPIPRSAEKSLAQLTVFADRLPESTRNAVNAYVEIGRLGDPVPLTELVGFDVYA